MLIRVCVTQKDKCGPVLLNPKPSCFGIKTGSGKISHVRCVAPRCIDLPQKPRCSTGGRRCGKWLLVRPPKLAALAYAEHLHIMYHETFRDWGVYDTRGFESEDAPLLYGGTDSALTPDLVPPRSWVADAQYVPCRLSSLSPLPRTLPLSCGNCGAGIRTRRQQTMAPARTSSH